MRKILLIVTIGLSLFSCVEVAKDKSYQVQMEIHYPSKIDTVIVEGVSCKYPTLYSSEGTNYVSPGFYSTSAPIKILKITELDSTVSK